MYTTPYTGYAGGNERIPGHTQVMHYARGDDTRTAYRKGHGSGSGDTERDGHWKAKF